MRDRKVLVGWKELVVEIFVSLVAHGADAYFSVEADESL